MALTLRQRLALTTNMICNEEEIPRWMRIRLVRGAGISFHDKMAQIIMHSRGAMENWTPPTVKDDNIVFSEMDIFRLIDYMAVCGYIVSKDAERWKTEMRAIFKEKRNKMFDEIAAEYGEQL